MKKIYASIIALVTVSAAHGQTLTQASNAPANGDLYSTLQCDSLNVSPGPSGANATWSFGALVIHNSVISNYTTMPSSTAAYPAGALVTAASINDQAFHISTATDMRYYGGTLKVQAVTANLIYSSPATFASFPMSLNTSSTAPIAGTINITQPFPINGTFTGNSSVVADGSGTLSLPGGAQGTYNNVLRVTTTQTLNYSATGITGVVTWRKYDYYTPTVKAPLLTISHYTLTSNVQGPSTQSMVAVNKNYLQTPTSIGKNASATADLLVYPNPASTQVSFSTENKAAKEVRIFDLTGKLIESKLLSDGSVKLDVSAYGKGLYLYSILNNSGETLKSGKITVD